MYNLDEDVREVKLYAKHIRAQTEQGFLSNLKCIKTEIGTRDSSFSHTHSGCGILIRKEKEDGLI